GGIMSTTTMVHIRIEERLKEEAGEALAAMGLSMSDAVRVFLTRVAAEKQLPFAVKVPNIETRTAMIEANSIINSKKLKFKNSQELFDDLEKNSRK
ncbi:MAG: type II toxin-antitoxin system RelB/DinJ family antitoxin, partial [Bdellovibrionota bacterium]